MHPDATARGRTFRLRALTPSARACV